MSTTNGSNTFLKMFLANTTENTGKGTSLDNLCLFAGTKFVVWLRSFLDTWILKKMGMRRDGDSFCQALVHSFSQI